MDQEDMDRELSELKKDAELQAIEDRKPNIFDLWIEINHCPVKCGLWKSWFEKRQKDG